MAASIIKALAPATIHKIAAGEVIERPANAVKELVENALDARAGKIRVDIEDGGMELIKVGDNGVGMTSEDVRVAWLPHTTSKIREADDLMRVATYGFRGEALCSMAAVAELTIETRHASEATGTAVTVSDSREVETREIGRNPGTTVTVKNLFLHSPVRRKFMGSGRTETARILGMVSRLALAHPGVAFKVVDRGREVLTLSEGSLKHRVGEILGFNVTNELAPVEWTEAGGSAGSIHIEGYISTAQQARQRASHQYFFINRRAIQSGLIARALSQAYDVLPPGRFPMAALYLTLPTEEVDVNVHPTKKEVRFLNESRIFWAVSQAVKIALRKVGGAPALDLDFPEAPGAAPGEVTGMVPGAGIPAGVSGRAPGAGPSAPAFRFEDYAATGAEAASAGVPETSPAGVPGGRQSVLPGAWPGVPGVSSAVPGVSPGVPGVSPGGGSDASRFRDPGVDSGLSRVAEPAEPWSAGRPGENDGRETVERSSNQLRLFPGEGRVPGRPVSEVPPGAASGGGVPYLQLHSGFILFGVQSGLMMVNQQAAHERILYEKALEELRQPGRFNSQQLLFPEVVEFTPGDSLFLEENLPRLQALGFDLEAFGGNTFQLRGLPMEVRPDQARRVLFDLVQGLLRPERGAGGPKGEEFQQRLARVYARVTSVKLGDSLDYPQVAALVDGLFATQNPYVSPSGAPIVVRLSLDEIQRKFGLKA